MKIGKVIRRPETFYCNIQLDAELFLHIRDLIHTKLQDLILLEIAAKIKNNLYENWK